LYIESPHLFIIKHNTELCTHPECTFAIVLSFEGAEGTYVLTLYFEDLSHVKYYINAATSRSSIDICAPDDSS